MPFTSPRTTLLSKARVLCALMTALAICVMSAALALAAPEGDMSYKVDVPAPKPTGPINWLGKQRADPPEQTMPQQSPRTKKQAAPRKEKPAPPDRSPIVVLTPIAFLAGYNNAATELHAPQVGLIPLEKDNGNSGYIYVYKVGENIGLNIVTLAKGSAPIMFGFGGAGDGKEESGMELIRSAQCFVVALTPAMPPQDRVKVMKHLGLGGEVADGHKRTWRGKSMYIESWFDPKAGLVLRAEPLVDGQP